MIKEKIQSFAQALIEQTKDTYIKSKRTAALKVFKEKGFPTKKMEAWKYTSLNPHLKEEYALETPDTHKFNTVEQYTIDASHHHMVFINGKHQAQLSTISEEKLTVLSMKEAMNSSEHQADIQKHWAQIADVQESMTALNTATATDGVFIKVSKSKAVEKPIEMIFISTELSSAQMTQLRNLIIAEENAQIQITERHINTTNQKVFTNIVTEIYTAKNAFVDYYKLQDDTEQTILIDNTYAVQADNSHASVHTFSVGGALVRNNLNFYQRGEHIDSTLKGITVLSNRQHTDHYTLVNHEQPHCESHQDYKSILLDHSTMAFNGKIMVKKIAQKTNAYQQNNNILLSDKAEAYTKPQLEIFADDVKCSHGCTIGQLDAEALFYLQTRGISKKKAEALLTFAFAHSVLSSVKIPALIEMVENKLREKI